jgi:hypothetical protein
MPSVFGKDKKKKELIEVIVLQHFTLHHFITKGVERNFQCCDEKVQPFSW